MKSGNLWKKVFENDAFCGIMHETAAEQKESRSPEVPAEIVILFILMSIVFFIWSMKQMIFVISRLKDNDE